MGGKEGGRGRDGGAVTAFCFPADRLAMCCCCCCFLAPGLFFSKHSEWKTSSGVAPTPRTQPWPPFRRSVFRHFENWGRLGRWWSRGFVRLVCDGWVGENGWVGERSATSLSSAYSLTPLTPLTCTHVFMCLFLCFLGGVVGGWYARSTVHLLPACFQALGGLDNAGIM